MQKLQLCPITIIREKVSANKKLQKIEFSLKFKLKISN